TPPRRTPSRRDTNPTTAVVPHHTGTPYQPPPWYHTIQRNHINVDNAPYKGPDEKEARPALCINSPVYSFFSLPPSTHLQFLLLASACILCIFVSLYVRCVYFLFPQVRSPFFSSDPCIRLSYPCN